MASSKIQQILTGLFLPPENPSPGDDMTPINHSTAILRITQQIYELKQQIEAADPQDRRRLQHRLKELQILQLWQLELEGK
jgi:hypothetical protein